MLFLKLWSSFTSFHTSLSTYRYDQLCKTARRRYSVDTVFSEHNSAWFPCKRPGILETNGETLPQLHAVVCKEAEINIEIPTMQIRLYLKLERIGGKYQRRVECSIIFPRDSVRNIRPVQRDVMENFGAEKNAKSNSMTLG